MHLVDSRRGLELIADSLAQAKTLYVDTEFDSSRDGHLLCLVQLSDGVGRVHLIDALRAKSLEPLGPIFSDPSREWVLHAGAQDVELLARQFSLSEPPRVFDTQVAWALSSAENSVSLSYLRFRLLGIRTGKSHQADDWKRRPLPAAQLAYAASDIEDLPALHRALRDRLEERDRLRFVHAASIESTWSVKEPPEALSLGSFRNAWQLDVHCQAALRFLVDWYNALSPSERASAPDAKALLAIANRLPRDADELSRIKGVPRRFAAAHGKRLAADMLRAAEAADASDFVPLDPPPYATFDEIRQDGWLALARAELSAELGVAPELLFPGRLMRQIRKALLESSRRASGADVLEGWRRELAAEAWRRFAAD